MTGRSRAAWGASLLVLLLGCTAPRAPGTSDGDGRIDGGRLDVYVVNYPLAYLAERVGGDAVRVVFPAPPDVDPAFWAPDAEEITAFHDADLILLNGAGYARWIERATLPSSGLVDTSKAFRERYVVEDDAVTHAHGPGGAHSHGEVAFTTWLDPTLAVEHARATLQALSEARPEQAASFEAAFDALESDLMQLDRRLAQATSRKTPLLGSHPVYQYLARRYELELESVHFEPDEEPDPEAWKELRDLLSRHPARVMLWEARPLASTATRLRELGVDSVVFDPCANRPSDGDYLDVMRANAARLQEVLGADS